ncbi:MAG: sugar transferase [Methanosarcinales archaeon]
MTNIVYIQDFLTTNYESQVISFITEHIPLEFISDENYVLIEDAHRLENLKDTNHYNLVVSSLLLNDFVDVNQSLVKIHNSLRPGGKFIGRVKTLHHRKRRIASFHNKFSYKVIILYEFIFKRVLPKLPVLRHVYRRFGIIKHHILSKCEALGRLRYCGFEISNLKETDKYLYFIAFKNLQPLNEKPCDGILIKIPKVGEDGRTIYCYKLRTMHAYANFLHDYILNNHQIDNEGKVISDFRTPGWGKFLRKTWLDEMPQLLNIIKGDLYFIGLRPLSREFLSLYPEEWREVRVKIKPGFVPPYYADCPKSFEEIIESEKRYYEAWKKHPSKTNFIYFWKVVLNFVIGRARTG